MISTTTCQLHCAFDKKLFRRDLSQLGDSLSICKYEVESGLKYLYVNESKEFGRPENPDSNVSPIYRPFCAVRFFERSSFSLKMLPLEANARKEVK